MIIHGEDMPASFVQVGFQALYMTGWSVGAMVGVGPPKTGSWIIRRFTIQRSKEHNGRKSLHIWRKCVGLIHVNSSTAAWWCVASSSCRSGFGTVGSNLGLPDAGLASYRDMVERVPRNIWIHLRHLKRNASVSKLTVECGTIYLTWYASYIIILVWIYVDIIHMNHMWVIWHMLC